MWHGAQSTPRVFRDPRLVGCGFPSDPTISFPGQGSVSIHIHQVTWSNWPHLLGMCCPPLPMSPWVPSPFLHTLNRRRLVSRWEGCPLTAGGRLAGGPKAPGGFRLPYLLTDGVSYTFPAPVALMGPLLGMIIISKTWAWPNTDPLHALLPCWSHFPPCCSAFWKMPPKNPFCADHRLRTYSWGPQPKTHLPVS